ncbi:hypothetical protein N9V74_08355 [Alteromonas sp.]|nr:hypothetical protein [Alteromonas sp.]
MRLILLLLAATSFYTFANEEITIHVKESTYSVGNSVEVLTNIELEDQLGELNFSAITLDVDYCAEPLTIANAYLAIANSKPSVTDIKLKLSGSHEESKCNNV